MRQCAEQMNCNPGLPAYGVILFPTMGRTHIVFSVYPVGVGVATCLHSISLLNGQILAKLTQIYHWEGDKC